MSHTENQNETWEHPEDVAMRQKGEAQAKRFGPGILGSLDARAVLCRLIMTYSDADAETQLWALREQFWGIDLPAAVKRALAHKEGGG